VTTDWDGYLQGVCPGGSGIRQLCYPGRPIGGGQGRERKAQQQGYPQGYQSSLLNSAFAQPRAQPAIIVSVNNAIAAG